MPIRTYHDLDVFRESYSAALDVSRLCKRLPAMEQYELARQLRRAARSIPANIVEGWGKRASAAEFRTIFTNRNRILRRDQDVVGFEQG